MSITLVSPQPKPAQAAAAADNTANNTSGNDAVTAGQDFASLLLGQLVPLTTETIPETPLKAELPSEEAVSVDTTNLFAALGMVPAEMKPVTNARTSSDSALSAKIAGDSDLPALGKSDSTMDSLKNLQAQAALASQKTSSASTDTPQETHAGPLISDKPAKFAVPALSPEPEKLVSTKSTSDTLTTTTVTTQAPAAQNSLPVRNETQITVATPVRDQSWTNDFSQKVVWLASNDKQTAQITLNPPQMGPIEVSITMDKGTASASFVSANQEVRDSIETALPRLREMFASAGIELGQTNVSSESFQQQANKDEWKSATPRWSNDQAILVGSTSGTLPARAFLSQQGNGRVDIFA
ncbi:MAG: flagellar hook-length control protein FliK [Betaproteobacteria bacterium]